MRIKFVGILIFSLAFACTNSENISPKKTKETATLKDSDARLADLQRKIDSLSTLNLERPNNIDVLLKRAELYMEVPNPSYAKADVDAAFFLDSSRADVLLSRGEVYYVLNKTRTSRDMWEKCASLFSDDVECRMRMTELYIAVGDFEAALKLINEVLNLEPQRANAIFMKGVIVRDLYADTTLAMQYFQRAIDLKDGNYIEALDMMGVMLAHKQDPMAIQYFKNALELAPNRADLYHKIGLSYTYIDEYNSALEAYEKSLQLNPRNDEVYFNIGFIHISLKNYDLAIDNFNKALELREMGVKALYGRAFAYEMRGDVLNARKDYQSCLGMFPDYKPAQIGLERVNRMLAEEGID
jgi:tetratricopeptide (TPR) repeat protein